MIRYYKLFDLLNRRHIKLSDLRNILSSATVAKLRKGAYISGEAIEKICLYLGCQPGDIMEVTHDEKESNGLKMYTTDNIYEINDDENIKYEEINIRNEENEIIYQEKKPDVDVI